MSSKDRVTILDEIAGKTRLRVAKAKQAVPAEQMQAKALAVAAAATAPGATAATAAAAFLPALASPCAAAPAAPAASPATPAAPELPFEAALKQPGLSFICEVKKASPSKGIIARDFPWLDIAHDYEKAGAAAISVLTEPDYFLGSGRHLQEIAKAVKIPCLRKDFTIDPYQIYEAKVLGAEAVLFICALLDLKTLASFIKIAQDLKLSALVEIHDKAEAEKALEAGSRIIGINNRDLKTFTIDFGLGTALRRSIPTGILTVAESGVSSPEDIRSLNGFAFDGVLIGESLMRSSDKKQFLAELKAASRSTAAQEDL